MTVDDSDRRVPRQSDPQDIRFSKTEQAPRTQGYDAAAGFPYIPIVNRRLGLLAVEEQAVEAPVVLLGVPRSGARHGDGKQRAGRQGRGLAFGLAEMRLADTLVVEHGLALRQAGLLAADQAAVLELQGAAVPALGHLRLLLGVATT